MRCTNFRFGLFAALLWGLVACQAQKPTSAVAWQWDFGPESTHHGDYQRPQIGTALSLLGTAEPSRYQVLSDSPVRDRASRDGVVADCVALQLQSALEDMWLFALDAGRQDQITTEVTVDDVLLPQQWSPFKTPSEERIKPKDNLYFALVPANANGQQVQLCNREQPVMLTAAWRLSASDIQALWQVMAKQAPDFALQQGYFSDLAVSLQRQLPSNPAAKFVAQWLWQAETLTEMMGWEWATADTQMSIFARYHQSVLIWDMLIALAPEVSAWQDRFRMERARLLFWLWREQYGEAEYAGFQRDIQWLAKRYPAHPRIQMYAGKAIANPQRAKVLIDAQAPPWSKLQAQVLAELQDIAHWWTDVRQASNGELGGKIGDDVELMRWWPILTALDDQNVMAGWEKLADTVWQHPKVANGYSSKVLDVEHASEFIADTAPGMAYFSAAPWREQLIQNVRNWPKWVAQDKDGDWFFRSAWFSHDTVDERPPRNRDLDMNARAMKPLRFLAVLDQHTQAKQQVVAWAKAWQKLAMGSAKGKPSGVFPVSYRVSDSQVNGDQPNWYQADMLWPYFEWPRNPGTKLYQHLLVAYLLSQDKDLLTPMAASLGLIAKHYVEGVPGEPGSAQWAAFHLARKSSFWQTAGEWRLLSGERRFDDLLIQQGDAHQQWLLTSDTTRLETQLEGMLQGLTHNRPLQTEEVLFTDRLFLADSRYADYPLVYAMLTGDMSGANNPFTHVTYRQTPAGFSALTRVTDPQRLQLDIFLHPQNTVTKRQPIGVRLWRLPMGKVEVQINNQAPYMAKINKPGDTLWFDLAEGQLQRLRIAAAAGE